MKLQPSNPSSMSYNALNSDQYYFSLQSSQNRDYTHKFLPEIQGPSLLKEVIFFIYMSLDQCLKADDTNNIF